jgi:hypothetical protein
MQFSSNDYLLLHYRTCHYLAKNYLDMYDKTGNDVFWDKFEQKMNDLDKHEQEIQSRGLSIPRVS